ncbi:hypothetical protein Ndes2526B_g06576 [Nannochloris sp. 'desiccata']
MTSVIYFKLKNAIQQQLVNFDGSVIQIGDVKRLIATKQGLGPDGALELTLSDPNTGDEYSDDGKPLVAGETGTASAAQPTASADPFGEAPAAGAAGGAGKVLCVAEGEAVGGRGGAAGGGVAPEYKCPRCDAIGVHWLQDCPTQGDPAYDRKRVRPPCRYPNGHDWLGHKKVAWSFLTVKPAHWSPTRTPLLEKSSV